MKFNLVCFLFSQLTDHCVYYRVYVYTFFLVSILNSSMTRRVYIPCPSDIFYVYYGKLNYIQYKLPQQH